MVHVTRIKHRQSLKSWSGAIGLTAKWSAWWSSCCSLVGSSTFQLLSRREETSRSVSSRPTRRNSGKSASSGASWTTRLLPLTNWAWPLPGWGFDYLTKFQVRFRFLKFSFNLKSNFLNCFAERKASTSKANDKTAKDVPINLLEPYEIDVQRSKIQAISSEILSNLTINLNLKFENYRRIWYPDRTVWSGT